MHAGPPAGGHGDIKDMVIALLASVVTAYAPPGLLAGLVELKEREVAQLKKLPEAREDGPWALRLAYQAAE